MWCPNHGYITNDEYIRQLVSPYANRGHGDIDEEEWSEPLCPYCETELQESWRCHDCEDDFDMETKSYRIGRQDLCESCYAERLMSAMYDRFVDECKTSLMSIMTWELDRAEEVVKNWIEENVK